MTHYSPLISAFVTLLLALILTLNKSGELQDISSLSSLRTEVISRTGGIALMAGILLGWIPLVKAWAWWIVLPALGLFVLLRLDEVHKIPLRMRMLGHFFAASVVCWGAGISQLWLFPTVLYIVWMSNLYSLMDGADGMASGMSLFGFSFYGVVCLMNGNEAVALMNFSIGAAALGFLYHNFYPARVYMGKSGSITLGFLAAAFGVWGWHQSYWPFWFPILVFSPFVVDATLSVISRARQGEKFTQVHHGCYYQRLAQMGWGNQKITIAEYVLMFSAGVSALWGISQDVKGQVNLLALWSGIYVGLTMWVDRGLRKKQFKHEHKNGI